MRNTQGEDLPPSTDPMADGMPYPSTANPYYAPPPSYYPAPPTGPVHVVAPPPRPETNQRKRPKYTRSKTGCLTCRIKKIKCDETKPNCMRCTHGQRDCTWPEGVPARKKSTSRKDGLDNDGRPSTAGSSGVSEASTPPVRDNSPPRRAGPGDMSLPPIMSRHPSDAYLPQSMVPDPELARRQGAGPMDRSSPAHGYPMQHPSTNPNVLNMIPEIASYPIAPRYEHGYPSNGSRPPTQPVVSNRGASSSSHATSAGMRPPGQQVAAHWNNPNPTLMAPVDPIEPFFHSDQERNLIRHYCVSSTSIIMAVPHENPVVAANLPLVLSRPPGSDPAIDALRLSLLGVAAVHQAFLLSRISGTQHTADGMIRVAQSYRMKSKQLLATACQTIEGTTSDAALSASIAIALMDIFSGGRNWLKNMDLAKVLVDVRGGPTAVLSSSSDLTVSAGAVNGSSRARLLLEILSVYDIFGCLSTGKEPSLLNDGASSWWLDESHTGHSYVESVFGMSRAFVPLLARVTTFVSRRLNNVAYIAEFSDDGGDASAMELYSALEMWSQPVDGLSTRVHRGNCIYLKACQIMLLRDIMQVPPTDDLVQRCCDTVLALCLECSTSKMGVDLIWPVIIAGSQTYGNGRQRVAQIFQAFRTQCCYEIDTSEQIVLQVWRRLDQQLPNADWRSVIKDLNLNVLII
ncbi:hypothetical protein PLICRDRAFT_37687 [Plicaturopsis crispa FD-325 SS-3]|nr:hypothetical protein PLICRDRAFT_37687 [Plicaturopsis crispa FD-325 SS-3]